MSRDLLLTAIAGGVLVAMYAAYNNYMGSGYTKKEAIASTEKKKRLLVVAGPYSRYLT